MEGREIQFAIVGLMLLCSVLVIALAVLAVSFGRKRKAMRSLIDEEKEVNDLLEVQINQQERTISLLKDAFTNTLI